MHNAEVHACAVMMIIVFFISSAYVLSSVHISQAH